MSTDHEPAAPNMKRVYLRRRLTVLAVLLAVIVAIVLVIVQPGSRGGTTSANEVEVPSDLAASAQSETAQADSPGEQAACAAGDVRVLPVTSRESYAPNELPELSLSVENISAEACHTDVGTSTMSFVVSSGSDEVWRSTDCQQNGNQLPVILEPGTPLVTEPLLWDRTRSNPETCDIGQDLEVGAGGATYHLRVQAAGLDGDGTAPFLLY